MAESLRNGSVARARWVWLVLSAIALSAPGGFAASESLSARVRACAAEIDSLRRLVCYDKEVAPFAEAVPPTDNKRDTPAECCARPSAGAAPPDPSSTEQTQSTARSAQKEPRHVTARVVSIEYVHSEMLLHLDNGQVWQQVQEASAAMNLRAGDTVTIDTNLLGSYWLGGRTAGVMKVQRKE